MDNPEWEPCEEYGHEYREVDDNVYVCQDCDDKYEENDCE